MMQTKKKSTTMRRRKLSSTSSLPYLLFWQRSTTTTTITTVIIFSIFLLLTMEDVSAYTSTSSRLSSSSPFFFRTTTTATNTGVLFASTEESVTTNGKANNNNNNNAAQKLLDKAAALRAEIAQMEGKTIEQVNAEAKEKKEMEEMERQRRLVKKEEERIKREEENISGTVSNMEKLEREGRMLQLPNNVDDMIRQAARAVERAFQDGQTRQTVRFNLVDVTAGQRQQQGGRNQGQPMMFDGSYIDALDDTNEWPGGAKQIYRESAKPLTTALLREIRAPTNQTAYEQSTKLPPKIIEQDIWDFDGSALHTTEACEGPSGDVQALVLPNTDVKYIRDIEEISNVMKDRLFLIINPFWKNIDSWSFNLLAPNAKQRANDVIFGGAGIEENKQDDDGNDNDDVTLSNHDNDKGYMETYVLMVFSCRGEKCIALKSYPYEWQFFAILENYDTNMNNDRESVIRLGSSRKEPTSSYITKLINARPEFKETKTMRQMKNTRMF